MGKALKTGIATFTYYATGSVDEDTSDEGYAFSVDPKMHLRADSVEVVNISSVDYHAFIPIGSSIVKTTQSDYAGTATELGVNIVSNNQPYVRFNPTSLNLGSLADDNMVVLVSVNALLKQEEYSYNSPISISLSEEVDGRVGWELFNTKTGTSTGLNTSTGNAYTTGGARKPNTDINLEVLRMVNDGSNTDIYVSINNMSDLQLNKDNHAKPTSYTNLQIGRGGNGVGAQGISMDVYDVIVFENLGSNAEAVYDEVRTYVQDRYNIDFNTY